MNVWHLVLREISHRKLNFILGLSSVAMAVACLVGAITLLQADQIRTREILAAKQTEVKQAVAQKQQEVEAAGRKLEDEMRKITKGLGFNILVLPKDQDLNELHVEGTLSKTMPEEYVDRLANSRIVTINHLLPTVTRKIRWEELDQTVILTGTRGEVPLMHRGLKKPLQELVPPGTMVLGYEIHSRHHLSPGDEVTLMGKTFKIIDCYEQRGAADDSTVWINLAQAQELLGMQNLVNAVLALECNCATKDRLGQIREEISAILPGTQIIERGTTALARAKARTEAKRTAEASLVREVQAGTEAMQREAVSRAQLRQQRENFTAVLVPLVVVGCAVWIGLLALGNVRQRNTEIGILRAIGLRSVQILSIFLAKALLVGLVGAIFGYAAGFGIGVAWGDLPTSAATSARLFLPELLLIALVMAPLLSGLASWIPAILAARRDPAVVLQEQ